MRLIAVVVITVSLLVSRAQADVPRVAVDIVPVYALVAQVMEGVGTPELIVPQNASPHGYSMRPSEARNLERADVVFWVGSVLTPWLEKSIDTLAGEAQHLSLLGAPGTQLLEFREGAAFDAHDHDHGHDHEEKTSQDGDHAKGHDDDHAHDEHAHEEEHGHEDEHGHDEHAGSGMDPHAWLDPQNGAIWLQEIANVLAKVDPENASSYLSNAAAAVSALDVTQKQIMQRLAPVQGQPFVVLHDAFHYFEARFGVEAIASISLGDASSPSAARVAEVRARVEETGARCILLEPEQSEGLAQSVARDASMKTIVVSPLSPLMSDLGPDSYTNLLVELSESLRSCLMAAS